MALTATSHDWNTPFEARDIEFVGTRVLTIGNGSTGAGNMGVAVWDRSTSSGRLWLTDVAETSCACLVVGSKLYTTTRYNYYSQNGLYVWDFSDWDNPTCTKIGAPRHSGFGASDGSYLCTWRGVVNLSTLSYGTVSSFIDTGYNWYASGGVGYACLNNTTSLYLVNLSTRSVSSTVTLPRTIMTTPHPQRTITFFDGKLWFATNDSVPTMMTYRLSDGDVQVFTVATPGGSIPGSGVYNGNKITGVMLVGPDDLFYTVGTAMYDSGLSLWYYLAALNGVFDPATSSWWTESFAATPANQLNPRFNGSKLWTVTGPSSPAWP